MATQRVEQHLYHKNEKTNKFWSISTHGLSYTIKEGTPDKVKTKTKTFTDEWLCLEEARKLVEQKLKTGYKQNTSPGSRDYEAAEQQKAARKYNKDDPGVRRAGSY